jgi:hypothetical protein
MRQQITHIVRKCQWQIGMSRYKFRCYAFNVFASLSNDLKVANHCILNHSIF